MFPEPVPGSLFGMLCTNEWFLTTLTVFMEWRRKNRSIELVRWYIQGMVFNERNANTRIYKTFLSRWHWLPLRFPISYFYSISLSGINITFYWICSSSSFAIFNHVIIVSFPVETMIPPFSSSLTGSLGTTYFNPDPIRYQYLAIYYIIASFSQSIFPFSPQLHPKHFMVIFRFGEDNQTPFHFIQNSFLIFECLIDSVWGLR